MTCGEGHNAIARSIRDGFSAEDDVRILDIYAHLQKRDWYGKAYLFLVKHFPKSYTYFWNRLRKKNPERRYGRLVMGNTKNAIGEIERVLAEFQPDAVICTHNYASNAFCWLKIHNRFQGKLYSVFFDYVACPYWEGSVLCDGIFTPHEITHTELISRGFRKEQLLPFGFPVNPKFYEPISKRQARESLGIGEDEYVVLSVNGGFGVGKIASLIPHLKKAKTGGKKLRVLVVCGRNKRAYRKALKLVEKRGYEGVDVYGFVNNLPVMYSAADFVFLRGGGGSVSEALVKGVPFAVRERAVSQEKENGKLFAGYGVSYIMNRISDARTILEKQMNDSPLQTEGGGVLYRDLSVVKASQRWSLISAHSTRSNNKSNNLRARSFSCLEKDPAFFVA